MTRVAAAVLVLCASVPPVSADGSAGIEAGTRIRLHYRDASTANVVAVTGNLKSADDVTVALVDTGTNAVRVPAGDIVRIEVSRGRHRHARTGAIAGGAFGLVGGSVCLATGCGGNGATLARATVAWAGIGGLVGFLIRGEGWDEVSSGRVRVSVAPGCSRRTISIAAIVSWQ